MTYLLAIDQGTTSTRAIIFDADLRPVASAQREFPQHYPAPGWVEHDPEDLWDTTLATVMAALDKMQLPASALAGIGITNQRETTLVWDRKTGKPVHNAIVWQDRRTAPLCDRLKAEGVGADDRGPHRAAVGPLFLGHQGALDSGHLWPACAGRGGGNWPLARWTVF